MCRFAPHRQGRSAQVCSHCHDTCCRGSQRVMHREKHHSLARYHPRLNVQPTADIRKGLLLARNDQHSTLRVQWPS
jgi:hypothetical protein